MGFANPSAAFLLAVLAAAPALARPDLTGVWMLDGRAAEGELVLTGEGRRRMAAYDLLEDDPSLQCVPASVSRVWANPNVRIAFEQAGDSVRISYEFFDLRRDIPLGDASAMRDTPSTANVSGERFPTMGTSVARYEGERLVIETERYAPGYVRTSRGVPQSESSKTTEELWREGDALRLRLTYVDPTLFEKPFVLDHTFVNTGDTKVPLYECTDPDYDWFEQLNAPGRGNPQ